MTAPTEAKFVKIDSIATERSKAVMTFLRAVKKEAETFGKAMEKHAGSDAQAVVSAVSVLGILPGPPVPPEHTLNLGAIQCTVDLAVAMMLVACDPMNREHRRQLEGSIRWARDLVGPAGADR